MSDHLVPLVEIAAARVAAARGDGCGRDWFIRSCQCDVAAGARIARVIVGAARRNSAGEINAVSNASNNKEDGMVVIRRIMGKGKERGYEAGKEPKKGK